MSCFYPRHRVKTNAFTGRSLRYFLFIIFCLAGFVNAEAQVYQPITVTGFNQDLVANGSVAPSASTTAATDIQGTVLYEKGYGYCTNLYLQYGLPVNRIVNSASNAGVNYTLASYTGNNALFLTSSGQTGALTFSSTGSYDKLAILAASSEGASSFSAQLDFTDGTTTNYSFNVPDWYYGNNYAIAGTGRMSRNSCSTDESAGNPRLYDNLLTLTAADKLKLLKSITFTKSGSGGRTFIFAVTGVTAVNVPSAPINVSASNITTSGFTANWSAVSTATSYRLDVSTDPNFVTLLSGYNNLNVGNVTSYSLTGLPLATYYFRVRAVNANGQSLSSAVATANVTAPAAGALDFGGGLDYAVTSANVGITGNQPRTLEYWGKLNGNYEHQVNWGATFNNNKVFGTYTVNNTLQVYAWGANDYTVPNFTPDNQWHHFVVTYDGLVVKVYIDGVEKTPAIGIPRNLNTADGPLYIGTREDRTTAPFTGQLDEIRIWNRLLCQGEIVNNMNSELTLPQTGLVAYYKMNQGFVGASNISITTLVDATGQRNATPVGFGLTGTTSNFVAGKVAGTANPFAAPTVSVTSNGATTVCAPAAVTLMANPAQTGYTGAYTYQWYSSTAGSNTITAINGATDATFTPAATGNYSVMIGNGCSATSYPPTVVTINALPAAYNTTGGGSFCAGENGVTINLNGSQTGLNYQLVKGSSLIGTAKAGTGAALSFTNVADTGTYSITATNRATGCTSNMNGTATVNYYDRPTATLSGTTTICDGATATLTLVVTGSGTITGILSNGQSFSGMAPTINVAVQPVANTTYSIASLTDANCSATAAELSGTATITINSKPIIVTTNYTAFAGNDCTAQVAFAADVTGTPTPELVYTIRDSVITSPYVFATGTTTVTATATNSCESVSQTFTVTVSDTTKPVITAPAAVEAFTNEGCAAINVQLGTPITADNCGVATVTNDAPAIFPIGNTTITWTVTDKAGNFETVTQTVTITDNEKPVITAAANISINNDTGVCSATISIAAATATDNCSVAAPVGVRSDALPLTAPYPVGTTTITWSIMDANGNDANQVTQTVTVTDNEKPVITTGAAISANSDAGVCGATVGVLPATATDNCAVANPTGIRSDSLALTAIYPVGTTTITWTVTDIHGNAATPVIQAITVTDNEKPVIIAATNISVNNDANVCGARVTIAPATATDNCSVTPPVGVRNDALPLTALYPIGTTTITWTATDNHGNAAPPVVQTVKVTDAQKPVITAAANIIANNSKDVCGATIAITAATATDNCTAGAPAGTRSDNQPLTAIYPIGTTTITWNATDVNSNTAIPVQQTITVKDNQAPTITAPAAVVVNANNGQCVATNVALGTPEAADNCGVAAVTNNAPASFPVGSTTVTWMVKDVNGLTATVVQTVTVKDNQKPVATAPAAIVACNDLAGNRKTLTLTASDNCGVVSTSYSIAGASTTTGTGNTATANFSIGTSTITWTVTDVNGNSTTASTTVTINPLPVASLVVGNTNTFCDGITLTASATLSGPFTYQWLYCGQTIANTQALNLGNSNANGVYSLYVTDGKGCKSATAATYTYDKTTISGNYTILAIKDMDLGKNSQVQSGSVGLTAVGGRIDLERYTAVASTGAFVKASQIKVDNPVNVPNKIYAPVITTLPAMQYPSGTYPLLSFATVLPYQTAVLNGNYNQVYIKRNAKVTINGSVFRSISIEEGATVTFTNPVLNMGYLHIGEGLLGCGYTTVNFAENASVRVSGEVHVHEDCIVGNGNKLTFYIGDGTCDEEDFKVLGGNTRINANIYIPNGDLIVNARCGNNKYIWMTGQFIAEEVTSDDNVIWNNNACSAANSSAKMVDNAIASATTTGTEQEVSVAITDVKQKEEKTFIVQLKPNPTTTHFVLHITSGTKELVSIQIVDGAGRMQEVNNHAGLDADIKMGAALKAGTYFITVTQGHNKQVLKAIKLNN